MRTDLEGRLRDHDRVVGAKGRVQPELHLLDQMDVVAAGGAIGHRSDEARPQVGTVVFRHQLEHLVRAVPLGQAFPVDTPVRYAVYPWIATATQG